MKKFFLLVLASCASLTATAQSSEAFLKALIESYTQKTPLALTFPLGMTEAVAVRDKFLAEMEPTLGKPIGYKAALTNANAQRKFGVTSPVYGVLLEKMVLPSGSEVPVKFATHPLLEGDLIARVGSEDINKAQTPEDLLANIDALVPFLELPDLIFKRGVALNAPTLVAVNGGARKGIMGEPILLKADKDTAADLRKIRLEITDKSGEIVAFGYGKALMGDPVKVIGWLRDRLLSSGKKLKKGDLISLGSATAMVNVKEPGPMTLTYYGIPGKDRAAVTVNFVK